MYKLLIAISNSSVVATSSRNNIQSSRLCPQFSDKAPSVLYSQL